MHVLLCVSSLKECATANVSLLLCHADKCVFPIDNHGKGVQVCVYLYFCL